MYQKLKVFSYSSLSEEAKLALCQIYQDNKNYIKHNVLASSYYDDEDVPIACDDYSILDEWLLENGVFVNEYVLIECMW